MLPKEAVAEFKKIYKARFGIELPEKDAFKRASGLLNLYLAVYGKDTAKTIIKSSGELLGKQ